MVITGPFPPRHLVLGRNFPLHARELNIPRESNTNRDGRSCEIKHGTSEEIESLKFSNKRISVPLTRRDLKERLKEGENSFQACRTKCTNSGPRSRNIRLADKSVRFLPGSWRIKVLFQFDPGGSYI